MSVKEENLIDGAAGSLSWSGPRYLRCCAVLILMLVPFVDVGNGQEETPAPPPVSALPRADRERLNSKSDIKDRTRLALEMMNERLASAEKLVAGEDYDNLFKELGIFQAVMEDCLDFLHSRGVDRGKVLDNFKRFEMGIRPFMARLENIRREVPFKYEEYLGNLMKAVRDARTRATEPMFSDRIVPKARPTK